MTKIRDADSTFLIETPFDFFFTVICGDRRKLLDAEIEKWFEGFWYDGPDKTVW
jgi:hypothetical protein